MAIRWRQGRGCSVFAAGSGRYGKALTLSHVFTIICAYPLNAMIDTARSAAAMLLHCDRNCALNPRRTQPVRVDRNAFDPIPRITGVGRLCLQWDAATARPNIIGHLLLLATNSKEWLRLDPTRRILFCDAASVRVCRSFTPLGFRVSGQHERRVCV